MLLTAPKASTGLCTSTLTRPSSSTWGSPRPHLCVMDLSVQAAPRRRQSPPWHAERCPAPRQLSGACPNSQILLRRLATALLCSSSAMWWHARSHGKPPSPRRSNDPKRSSGKTNKSSRPYHDGTHSTEAQGQWPGRGHCQPPRRRRRDLSDSRWLDDGTQ